MIPWNILSFREFLSTFQLMHIFDKYWNCEEIQIAKHLTLSSFFEIQLKHEIPAPISFKTKENSNF